MNILVTGCAGFIGYHFVKKLLKTKKNIKIIGIDNINNYYDVSLKKYRLKKIKNRNFIFIKTDISNQKAIENIFKDNKIHIVVHLAAQAGVRTSINKPEIYNKSNVKGFFNILDCSRKNNISKFIFASTSSIYGNSEKFPTNELSNTNNPESFYAATKKINEIMAYSYSKIYKMNVISLRFFTVYGPLGRPDMAIYSFAKNILNNTPIKVFNYGNHIRDFTYIDDVVNAIHKLIKIKQKENFLILNVASGKKTKLMDLVKKIEKLLRKKANINFLNKQVGDVAKTHGEIKKIKSIIEYKNLTNIDKGLSKYIKWIKEYERKN